MKSIRVDVIFSSLLAMYLILFGTSIFVEAQIARTQELQLNAGIYKASALKIEPLNYKRNIVAIMLPGLLEPKETFKSLGLDLAKLGITSLAFDHPGDPRASPLNMDLAEDYNRTLGSMLNSAYYFYKALLESCLTQFKDKDIVLIGIGMGASVAIILASEFPQIKATIAISPDIINNFVLSHVNHETPKNFLVILGSLEIEKLAQVRLMMNHAGIKNITVNKVYGDFDEGNARMVAIVEFSASYLQYFHGGTLEKVRNWISSVFKISSVIYFSEGFRLYMLLATLLLALGISALAPAVFSNKFGMFSGGKRWPTLETYKQGLKIAFYWSILTLVYVPLTIPFFILFTKILMVPIFMTIIVSYDIVAILLALTIMAKQNGEGLKDTLFRVLTELYSDSKNIILGILVGGLQLLLLFVVLADIALYPFHIFYNPYLLLIALLFFPVQLIMNLSYERLFRRYIQEAFGGVTFRAVAITIAISFLARLLVIIFFDLIILFIAPNLGFGLMIFILLTFVQIVIEGVAAITYLYTREITPAAIGNSIWIFFVIALSPVVVTNQIQLGLLTL